MLNINLKENKSIFPNLEKKKIFFISPNQMDNMKVQELKAEAKRLGLRGYSRLRKAELINLLAGAQASPILDEPVPEINDSEILRPTKYVELERINGEVKREAKLREIRKLEEMLALRKTRNIPEIKVRYPEEEEREATREAKLKRQRDRKIREIKDINRKSIRLRISQTVNSLIGFARQFRFEGIEGFGPREFMHISIREEVLEI